MLIREEIFTNFPESKSERRLLSFCACRVGKSKEEEQSKVREEGGVAEETGFISIKDTLSAMKRI